MEYLLDLPGSTPPSFNAVGHTGNRWAWTRAKKEWQQTIETALLVAGVPRGLERAEVRALLSFPTNRRRDAGNYRTLLEKCTGDALVNGRWLLDDTPDRFSFGLVEFRLGAAATAIFVTPCRWEGRDDATPTLPMASQPAAPPRRLRRRVKG